jgi:hypothetical protein
VPGAESSVERTDQYGLQTEARSEAGLHLSALNCGTVGSGQVDGRRKQWDAPVGAREPGRRRAPILKP